jgi:hypothetical protein
MSKARTVQFRSVDQVVDAYRLQDIPCFCVWCEGVPQFPYEPTDIEDGAAYLQTLLEVIGKNSAAIYTLCLYKTVPEGELNNKTPFRCAFNFQLRRQGEDGSFPQPTGGGNYEMMRLLEMMQTSIKKLELRLDEQVDDDEEEEPRIPQPSRLGVLGEILSHPFMGPIAGELADKFVPGSGAKIAAAMAMQQSMPSPPAAGKPGGRLSGIPGAPAGQLSADQETKLTAAMETLRKLDPELGDHLLKLAQYAEKNFPGYQQLVAALQLLK